MQVQLFLTCLGENFFTPVLKNMVSVLEQLDVQVAMPEGQTCCGQPFFNSGFVSQSIAPAKNFLKVFGKTSGYIVAPSGSCVDFVRHHYTELFPEGTSEHAQAQEVAARTYEFSEFLVRVLKVSDVGAMFPHKVTYHASCHALRGLGLRTEAKQLLGAVQGLEFIPLNEEETCCGFGGVFSIVYPEVSRSMMQDKVKNIQDSGADVVVVGDPGCIMNIAGGLQKVGSPIRVMHLIDVLAAREGAR
jgi:L-lactate dehydrogenase complex protein LldE